MGSEATDLVHRVELEWPLDLHGDIKRLHVVTRADLVLRAEENSLELGNIRSDVAELVIPLVLGAAAIPLALGVLASVVKFSGANPASITDGRKVRGLLLSGGSSLDVVALLL